MTNSIIKLARLFQRDEKNTKYKSYPGLNGRIHEKDNMFEGDLKHYKAVGLSAMENIEASLKVANVSFESLKSVLDMPCGYGRVLRVLVSKIPAKKITACELEQDAIDFCEKEFGCKKLLSSNNIREITFPEKFSLIWVGSLFTHFNEEDFSRLLKLLFDSLDENGILIFTTHGSYSVEIFELYWPKDSVPITKEELQKELNQNNGFYYAPYSPSQSYGISISLQEYVVALIERLLNKKAEILRYAEKGWDNHQDVFAIQKKTNPGR